MSKGAPTSSRFEFKRVDRISKSDLCVVDEKSNQLLWVVVFGPGVGEGILVRLPDGRVGVVDGCREPGPKPHDGNPVANLLRELSPERLLFACLTHPHEDHYRGLGALLETEFNGKVDHVWNILSLTTREKDAVISWINRRYDKKPEQTPDAEKVKGLERALNALMENAKKGAARRQQLLAGRILLREEVFAHRLEIEAWGPADEEIDDSLFDYLFYKDGNQPHTEFDPNKISGALLLRWKRAKVLLAGDLLRAQSGDLRRGWGPAKKLLKRHKEVQVVNVSHHGSEEAHDKDLWGAMKPQLAIVTPFNNATGKQPPRPEDIERLLQTPCEVAITTPPAWFSEPGHSLVRGTPRSDPRKTPAKISKRLNATGKVAPNQRDNAVAVALSPDGEIVCVLLAGDADFYSFAP